MSDAIEWQKWSNARPTDHKLPYRWRVSTRLILGAILQPEWTDKMRLVGMGHADNEWWPPCSNWNGYNRTVEATLEWRPASADEITIQWNGLDLLPCPFTGKPPNVTYSGRWIGAPPYLPEHLSIEAWMVRSHGWSSAAKMAETWNRRPT